jgi:hypothetical protein
MRERYYIYTYDVEKEKFTPQPGVRCGPYSLFGLRKAILACRSMGYDDSVSILVTKGKKDE